VFLEALWQQWVNELQPAIAPTQGVEPCSAYYISRRTEQDSARPWQRKLLAGVADDHERRSQLLSQYDHGFFIWRNILEKLSLGRDRDPAMRPNGELHMMIKILSASVLTIALATSAMAQSSGSRSGTSGTGMSGTGTATGHTGVGSGMPGGNTGAGSGPSGTTIDPNATNSTNSGTAPNGMNDRCKDTAGNDADTNAAGGTATSNLQNCNK
jgi:hypothetical protein